VNIENIAEVVSHAADSVRKRPAVRRRVNISYSLTVKASYEEILGLRSDGYSYDLICEVFSENGLLPEHANPKTLCSAFLREKKRREKQKTQSSGTLKREATSNTPKAEPAKSDFDSALMEKERIKALTGATEETALGKLTKHSDGSFDFDWKN
jgi:hypothetical protein